MSDKVNWFRNESEKDQNRIKGTGNIVHIGWINNQGMAVIVDDKGNFVERNLGLIKVADLEEDPKIKLDEALAEISSLATQLTDSEIAIDVLKEELVEAKKVMDRLSKKPVTISKPVTKPVAPKKS